MMQFSSGVGFGSSNFIGMVLLLQVGLLDAAHGSALLNLGSTQVSVTARISSRMWSGLDAFTCHCEPWLDAPITGLQSLAGMQVLSVATIGNDQDGLFIDTLHGLESKRFLAHYKCPSFAVNEVCHIMPFNHNPLASFPV